LTWEILDKTIDLTEQRRKEKLRLENELTADGHAAVGPRTAEGTITVFDFQSPLCRMCAAGVPP
jgi:hypothetical protein